MKCAHCSKDLTAKQTWNRKMHRGMNSRPNEMGPFCSRACFNTYKIERSTSYRRKLKNVREDLECVRLIIDLDLNKNPGTSDKKLLKRNLHKFFLDSIVDALGKIVSLDEWRVEVNDRVASIRQLQLQRAQKKEEM